MIRSLVLALLLLLCSCAQLPPPPSDSAVSRLLIGGVLTVDTVLDGDYQLETDLQVPAGITLTIQPGSSILIVAADSTKIDPEYLSKEVEILVRGRLLAVGTAAQPIRLLVAGADREQIQWAGLEFVSSRGSQLEYLQIEQAENGILCLDSSPQLRFVQILRSRYAILLQQNSHPLISDSQFTDGEAGLFCWDQSAPILQRNTIAGNQEEGVYLGADCQAELQENLIKQNDRGVVLAEGVSLAPSNLIFDNRQDVRTYRLEAQP